jgi:quinoprotein glucose dehydrogenase
MPPGEWRAYGRSGLAQRYSPLTLITPENGTKAGDAVIAYALPRH